MALNLKHQAQPRFSVAVPTDAASMGHERSATAPLMVGRTKVVRRTPEAIPVVKNTTRPYPAFSKERCLLKWIFSSSAYKSLLLLNNSTIASL
jgi:hypothetical protein